MAIFEGAARRGGIRLTHGSVIGRLHRITMRRSLFLALRQTALRRRDKNTMNRFYLLARLLGINIFFGSLLYCLTASAAQAPTILVLGDSLSAAYGINVDRGWVALLRERLAQAGYPHRVVNASISGETTTGGLSRLPAALDAHHPGIVLIELGGNDGLRAQPLKKMRANLEEMARLSKAHQAQPVIFEMRIPSNYGATYGEGFRTVFADVAKSAKLPMVPFWLATIATDPKSFQDDGIHPTEAVQPKLLDAVWPTLKPLLKK